MELKDTLTKKLYKYKPCVRNYEFISEFENTKLSVIDLETLIILKKNFNLKLVDISTLIVFIKLAKLSKNNNFNCSYKFLQEHKENVSDIYTISKTFNKLANLNIITHVNKGLNGNEYNYKNKVWKETNLFCLNFEVNLDKEKDIYDIKGNTDFETFINKFYSKKIIVNTLTRGMKDKLREEGIYKNNKYQRKVTLKRVELTDTLTNEKNIYYMKEK